MPTPANTNPEVDAWFEKFEHPLRPAMLAVPRAILASDPRVSESIKWGTPTFAYRGNIVSFQPKANNFVSLLFHPGSEIPGDHPILEGDSALARVARFENEPDVDRKRPALQAATRSWCAMKDGFSA